MLHEILKAYLSEVEEAVLSCQEVYVERYLEEILTPERVNLRIRLRFSQGYLLEINEAVIVTGNELSSLDYRYHCQDEQNNLVFRYDSTPHFPDLPSFPHHKHLPNEVVACRKPTVKMALQEVVAQL
jgi:hypothetical protein